ncbi:TetR family transcriptional regulator [Nakamurella sp. YIM 132087]|uniref:TetR family transcriptional regulator n=1 Tax=Nakamurella alba TaxID=2665158 RepID=A0A7K1FPC2_9ACTN|nr:TetR/AcrR family transcriptional regulator [Nakamurella alba]MTD15991.1 TetR family transcriptional regulator [Nakamurella alba]
MSSRPAPGRTRKARVDPTTAGPALPVTPLPVAAPAVDWRSVPPTALSPILTEALAAFRENGYHGTSVRDIARRVGVTVPALYYHHANKEAILIGLLDPAITALYERCRLALADAGDDPVLGLSNLAECLMLHVTHNTHLAHLDNEIRSLSPFERESYVEKRRRIELLIRGTIENGVRSSVLVAESPKQTARALLGMFQSVAVWFRAGGERSATTVTADYVVTALRSVNAPERALQPFLG